MKTFFCVLRVPGFQPPHAISDTAALEVQGAHCAHAVFSAVLVPFAGWLFRLGSLPPSVSREPLPSFETQGQLTFSGNLLGAAGRVVPHHPHGASKARSRFSDFYTRVIIICSRVSPAKRGQAPYAQDKVRAVTSYRMKDQKN